MTTISDYEKMYYGLFNAVTNAITLLQEAQNNAEEVYINSNPVALQLLKIVPTQDSNKEEPTEKGGSHAK